jgi:carboxyl-terminal processing protease
MKNFSKNLGFIFFSLSLIVILFGGGYFVGKKAESNTAIPTNVVNLQDASTSIDLAPFWKVWNLIDKKFSASTSTQTISNQDRLYGAISGMVDSLKDPYTVFLTPEENKKFEESIQGNFEGVGMEIGIQDDILTVISPLKNTPAQKAGIVAGDKILEIDGVSTNGIKINEAVSKIRGKPGSEIKLKIFRVEQKEPFEVKIIRDVIIIPTIDTEMRKDGIFIISLYNFSANSVDGFRKAIREFYNSKSNKLILDLRGNPGGFLESSVEIAGWFLPVGKIIVKEQFNDKEEKIFRSKGPGMFNKDLKMVVLIDEGSASASEILAGALQQHGVATLVGKNTFGKGSVQELVEITPQTSLKVTIAQWLTPNGSSISDGGLVPDFVVENKYEENTKKLSQDLQLEEAIKILKK